MDAAKNCCLGYITLAVMNGNYSHRINEYKAPDSSDRNSLSTLSIIIIIVIIIINIYSHQLCLSRPTMNRPTLMQAYIGIQH